MHKIVKALMRTQCWKPRDCVNALKQIGEHAAYRGEKNKKPSLRIDAARDECYECDSEKTVERDMREISYDKRTILADYSLIRMFNVFDRIQTVIPMGDRVGEIMSGESHGKHKEGTDICKRFGDSRCDDAMGCESHERSVS